MMPAPTPHKPLSTRLFYASIKRGFLLVAAALALSVLTGCIDNAEDWGKGQLDVADAIAAAAKDAAR